MGLAGRRQTFLQILVRWVISVCKLLTKKLDKSKLEPHSEVPMEMLSCSNSSHWAKGGARETQIGNDMIGF